LELLGIIPRDEAVATAVRRRKPLVTGTPTPAVNALQGIAAKLRGVAWASLI
jgi:septum formation inhibitor-activating ATPase MinD